MPKATIPVQAPKTPIAIVFLHDIDNGYLFTAIECTRVDCCDLALKVSQRYPGWTIGATSWIVPQTQPVCEA